MPRGRRLPQSGRKRRWRPQTVISSQPTAAALRPSLWGLAPNPPLPTHTHTAGHPQDLLHGQPLGPAVPADVGPHRPSPCADGHGSRHQNLPRPLGDLRVGGSGGGKGGRGLEGGGWRPRGLPHQRTGGPLSYVPTALAGGALPTRSSYQSVSVVRGADRTERNSFGRLRFRFCHSQAVARTTQSVCAVCRPVE